MSISTLEDLLNQKSKEINETVIKWRRHFHENPELSFRETETSQFVYDTLKKFDGLEVSRPTQTGVVARLIGDQPGDVILLRADMDALPVSEETDLPFKSKNDGVMHACGHDGHTAVLLGVAQVLSELKKLIKGEIRFVFQPAEEVGGAPELLKTGILDGVKNAFALHLWSPLEIGKIGVIYGPAMAAGDLFTIKIKGRGGHGAIPQETIDPIMIGTEIVSSLQQIITRKLDPLDIKLLSVTKFTSGTNHNVIPDSAEIGGTIRALDSKVLDKMRELLKEIVEGICKTHHASFEIEFFTEGTEVTTPVLNDHAFTALVEEAIVESFGEEWVAHIRPTLAGEDFSVYTAQVPSTFLFIGVGNREKGSTYPHHHPKFDIDETALEYAVRVFLHVVRKTSM